jgi:hypothetical protein
MNATNVRRSNYTGIRQTQFDTAKVLYGRVRDIPAGVVADLNKREKQARKAQQKREAQRDALIQAEIARQLEEMRKKDEEKKLKAKKRRDELRQAKSIMGKFAQGIVLDLQIPAGEYEENQALFDAEIKDSLTKLKKGDFIYYQISENGTIGKSGLLEVKHENPESIFWETVVPIYQAYSGGEFDNAFVGAGKIRFVISKANEIPSAKLQQKYADDETKYCAILPLIDMWESYARNSESDASRIRCTQIANKLKKFADLHPAGVPEENMEELARMSHRCIVVYDILGGEMARYNKKSTKTFSFKNTRKDHLETKRGELTQNNLYQRVSREELNRIIEEHKRDDVFYHYEGDIKNDEGNAISSIRGSWAVFNDDYDLYKEFNEKIGINNYGLNAVKYDKLNEFVKESRLINSAPVALCDEPNNLDGCLSLDLTKAYTQHKMTKYYAGFMGHIQQYRKFNPLFGKADRKFLEDHLGIYQFRVLGNSNTLLKKLGIKVGQKYTLPSPEILYMIDKGVDVDIYGGCWGSKFDFDYDASLIEDTFVDGERVKNRKYCTWAGKLGTDNHLKTYMFPGDKEWASHLKYQLGDDKVLYFKEAGMIVVKVPKKSYMTKHHILSFITSYTRLNMLSVMEKVEDRLVKVILDGIYFRGDIPETDIPCKVEPGKKVHNFRDYWYYPAEVGVEGWSMYNKDLDGRCVLAGQGGTGKSYSVLADKSFIDPLYVVPMNNLGVKAINAYGGRYTTINKLIGMECRPFKDTDFVPGIIFIDELTMIEESWVKKAIEMYPNALIFLAGDIDEKKWFQTRNGKPGAFSKVYIPSDWKYVYYLNDRRSRDEELKKMKLYVRELMNKHFRDGGNLDAQRVIYDFKKEYPAIKMEEAVGMFNEGDTWIAGTHSTSEKLLKMGVKSGYINERNERCDNDDKGAKPRGSFTIHSYQGLTIDTGKVFVSLDCFEYAMLYTAISRAVNFSQIVLVN